MTQQEQHGPTWKSYPFLPETAGSVTPAPETVWRQLPDDSQLSLAELQRNAEMTASDRGYIPGMGPPPWYEFWIRPRMVRKVRLGLAVIATAILGNTIQLASGRDRASSSRGNYETALAPFRLHKTEMETEMAEPPITVQTLDSVDSSPVTDLGSVYEKPNSWYEVVVNDDEKPSEYRIFDVDLKPPQDER